MYVRGQLQQPQEGEQAALHQVQGHLVNYPYKFLQDDFVCTRGGKGGGGRGEEGGGKGKR